MRTFTKDELADILAKHSLYTMDRTGGVRADLSNADLQGHDLRQVNLRAADLQGSNLRGLDLRYTNFTGADLSKTDLSHANLHCANLELARLVRATMRGTVLTHADLRGATIQQSDMAGAKAYKATFSDAYVDHVNLREANLAQATFMEARIHTSTLQGTDCSRTQFYGASILSVDFTGARLTSSSFARAYLSDVCLKNAPLNFAHGDGVVIQSAVLDGEVCVWVQPPEGEVLLSIGCTTRKLSKWLKASTRYVHKEHGKNWKRWMDKYKKLLQLHIELSPAVPWFADVAPPVLTPSASDRARDGVPPLGVPIHRIISDEAFRDLATRFVIFNDPPSRIVVDAPSPHSGAAQPAGEAS